MDSDPDLPPMLPGLPNTPATNCRELLLQIIVRGLLDDDVRFVESRQFLNMCMYVGLSPLMAARVRLKFYRGEIDRLKLEGILYGAYIRRSIPEDAPVMWASWKGVPV
ncbi:MAG: hypothetical protein ACHQX3_08225 [Nitrospirales bacterium]